MRTIVVLLVAALVMTPALAHAQAPPAMGPEGLLILAVPVVAVALVVYGIIWIAKKAGAETEPPTQEAPSAPALAPEVGSDR